MEQFVYVAEFLGDDYGSGISHGKTRIYSDLNEALDSGAWIVRPQQLKRPGDDWFSGKDYSEENERIEIAKVKKRHAQNRMGI